MITTTQVYTRVVPSDLQKVHSKTSPNERLKKIDVPTYIVIQQSTNNSTWTTIATLSNPSATFYSVTGLAQGTSYYFRIAAGN